MKGPFTPIDLSLLAMQAPGEWAVNSGGIATFPGDAGYDESVAAAKAGRTSPVQTAPGAKDTSGPTIGSAITSAAKNAIIPGWGGMSGTGSDYGRMVAVVLGLILIAGGILLFKPVRETVVTAVKDGAQVAAVAA